MISPYSEYYKTIGDAQGGSDGGSRDIIRFLVGSTCAALAIFPCSDPNSVSFIESGSPVNSGKFWGHHTYLSLVRLFGLESSTELNVH